LTHWIRGIAPYFHHTQTHLASQVGLGLREPQLGQSFVGLQATVDIRFNIYSLTEAEQSILYRSSQLYFKVPVFFYFYLHLGLYMRAFIRRMIVKHSGPIGARDKETRER